MPLFRSKPSVIEAVQYGPEFSPGLVRRMASFIADDELPDNDGAIIEFVQPAATWDEDQAIQIRAGVDGAQGWVDVPLGHWIVRSRGVLNDHWPVDPDYFEAKYEPVGG